jgi:hypothetical protein
MFIRLFDEAAEAGISTGAAATSAASVGSGTSATPSTPAPASTGVPSGGRAEAGADFSATSAPSPAQTTVPESGAVPGQQAVAPAAQTLFDRLIAAGGPDFRGKYNDEEALTRGLANAARAMSQRNELAQIGQQVQPYMTEFQQWLSTRGQQQQQPQGQGQQQAQQQTDPYWDYPQADPSWAQFRTRDEEGNYDWSPNTPAEVRSSFDKWAGWRHRFDTQWQRDPLKLVESAFNRFYEQRVQKDIGQYDTQLTAKSIGQQTQQWMYQRDATGEIARDPMTMQPIIVPQYHYYREALQDLGDSGITDPVRLDAMAKKMAAGAMAMSGMIGGQQQQQQAPGLPPMATASVPVPPGALAVPNVSGGAGSVGSGVRGPAPQFKGNLAERLRQVAGYNAAVG